MEALVLVDIQIDFCPGGALPVPEGDKIVPIVNEIIHCFNLKVATKDWHPRDHKSFAINHPNKKVGEIVYIDGVEQVLWPVHCVQGTPGAEFHPELKSDKIDKIIYKGTDPNIDSYSGFFDNLRKRATGLDDFLKEKGVKTIYVAGLATDYCVKYTVLDGLELGYNVYVISDGIKGIDLNPGDIEKAVAEMKEKGAIFVSSEDIKNSAKCREPS